jgi:hypothetical protein
MGHWLVRLGGDRLDLVELPKLLHESVVAVREDRDGFYLQSPELEPLNDATAVRQRAIALVEGINGIGRVMIGNFKPVGVAHVIRVGEGKPNVITVEITEGIEMRSKLTAVSLTSEGEEIRDTNAAPASFKRGPAADWLERSLSDEAVAKVLRLLVRRPTTWIDLSKVFEIVQSTAGGAIQTAGWASRAEVDRFTHTANSVTVLGDAARHGHDKVRPPASPMTLQDADALIRKVVRNWLQTPK